MDTVTETPQTIEVCSDCVMLIANGEAHEWRGTEYVDIASELVDKIAAKWGDAQITLGRLLPCVEDECKEHGVTPCWRTGCYGNGHCTEHPHIQECPECFEDMRVSHHSKGEPGIHWICDCGEKLFVLTDGGDDGDDDAGFSWSGCESCGSPLGGDRHYATAWVKQ